MWTVDLFSCAQVWRGNLQSPYADAASVDRYSAQAGARRRQGSIAPRLLLRVLIFSCAITLILTAIQLVFDYRSAVATLQRQLNEIGHTYAESLGESLWILDKAQLALQLQGIMRLPDIHFVEVRETAVSPAPLVMSLGRHLATAAISRDFSLSCTCQMDGPHLGTLHVEASLSRTYDLLMTHALVTLLGIAAKTFLMALFVLYVLHELITRHLLDIANALARYDPSFRGPPLQLRRPRPKKGDELDRITDAFNAVSERLDSTFSELMNTQGALQRSERRYRDMIESLPVGVYTTDIDGRIMMFNEAAAKLWGRRPALYEEFWSGALRLHSIDGTPMLHADCPLAVSVRENRIIRDVEAIIQRPDGSRASVLPYPTPQHDDAGHVIGGINVLIDVTDRKRAEDRLRDTAAWLETLIDNLPGIVFRFRYPRNGDKQLLYIGGGGVPAEGFPVSGWHTMPPRQYREWFHPDDHRLLFDEVPLRLRENGHSEHRFRRFRRDGSIIWLFAREWVVGRDGDDLIVEGLSIDVTAEMTAKLALERQQEEQRKLELQLQETRRLEELGQLAGGIAHDFNNLLGAIIGFAQFIIEDTTPDDPAKGHARRILTAGKRGKQLVEGILGFARKAHSEHTSFLAIDLMDEIADLLQVTVPATTQIVYDIGDRRTMIHGNRGELGQLLLNLCLNAHDALEGQPGTVTVSTRPTHLGTEPLRRLTRGTSTDQITTIETWEDDDATAWAICGQFNPRHPYISFAVTDVGVGMNMALLQKAFSPLFTTKEKGRGTGLGLSIVVRNVIAHSGALIVRSRPGEGTRFEITLPCTAPLPGGREEQPREAPSLSGSRVLLVDDNLEFGDMLLLALERHGLEVTPCTSPTDALAAFQENPDLWDVVVTDHTMPEMCGLDLVRAIKVVRPNLPCVLCTGNAENLDDTKLRAAGAFTLIAKPVDVDAVLRTLGAAMA